uniref:Uncharacterized protein n=1 Tax=Cacopsylla melanoneura TaxID=428564 RepID=A0A8D8PVU9_9HEMI
MSRSLQQHPSPPDTEVAGSTHDLCRSKLHIQVQATGSTHDLCRTKLHIQVQATGSTHDLGRSKLHIQVRVSPTLTTLSNPLHCTVNVHCSRFKTHCHFQIQIQGR